MEMKPGYHETDLGLLPRDWSTTQLGEVGEALIGLTYTPSDVRPYGTLVLRSSNIQNDALAFEDNVFVDMEIPQRIMVRPGDVLICVRNGSRPLIGKTALLDERTVGMTFGAFMAVFRSAHGRYINYLFRSHIMKRQIDEHLGATINQITNKSLRSFQIPVPPKDDEIDAIATALSDVDALLEGLNRLIAKKRNLKRAAMQQLLSGKRRLQGFGGAKAAYKQTEVGEIPEDWDTPFLGELFTFKNGLNKAKQYFGSGTPIVNYMDVFEHPGLYAKGVYGRVEVNREELKAYKVRKGDVFFTRTSETIEEVGITSVMLDEPLDTVFSGFVLRARPKDKSLSDQFKKFCFSSSVVRKQIISKGTYTTRALTNGRSLSTVAIIRPPIHEQRAIAEVLSDMDAEIVALESRREKTCDLKRGMMQELLTGKTRLVEPKVSDNQAEAMSGNAKGHNWAINEAVVIATLVKSFGTEDHPLGRKRYTKLSYLLHRRVEQRAEGYLKKAAGPYNPQTKYGGPEKIAKQNGYIREHKGPKGHSGFIAADNVAQAEAYFEKWYGLEVIQWLEQFRYKKNDDLEALATVDMAAVELRTAGQSVDVAAVKDVITNHQEWEAKLDRAAFSDANIAEAIKQSDVLLGPESTGGFHA